MHTFWKKSASSGEPHQQNKCKCAGEDRHAKIHRMYDRKYPKLLIIFHERTSWLDVLTLEAPSSARSLQLYRGYIFHLSYCEYSHPEIEHMRTDQLDITWRRTKFTLSAVHGFFLHENYVKVDLFTNIWIWVCHLQDHLVLRCSCNWISQK